MSRETVEEVFRRVQSEARHEARLELRRDLERRHQRKLEYRKKREKDSRLLHAKDGMRPPATTDPNLMKRSRAILSKPKKKVLSSVQSVTIVPREETTCEPPDCVLATSNIPPRRDVATATDPFYTQYPTRSRFEEVTEVKSQDQPTVDDPLPDQKQDDISTNDVKIIEEGCQTTPGNGVSESKVGMADWEKAWYQLAMEEIDDNSEESLGWVDGAAQKPCREGCERLEP